METLKTEEIIDFDGSLTLYRHNFDFLDKILFCFFWFICGQLVDQNSHDEFLRPNPPNFGTCRVGP